jgi:hypothetical protein
VLFYVTLTDRDPGLLLVRSALSGMGMIYTLAGVDGKVVRLSVDLGWVGWFEVHMYVRSGQVISLRYVLVSSLLGARRETLPTGNPLV